MKYLQLEMRNAGHIGPLAYYHAHWTRDGSPLLDELGAVIDHKNAHARGGQHTEDNLCTACGKCNTRKSSAPLENWNQRDKRKLIKGKYGEPKHWDGFSSLFVVLAKRNSAALTTADSSWLNALAGSAEMATKP